MQRSMLELVSDQTEPLGRAGGERERDSSFARGEQSNPQHCAMARARVEESLR